MDQVSFFTQGGQKPFKVALCHIPVGYGTKNHRTDCQGLARATTLSHLTGRETEALKGNFPLKPYN